MHTRRLLHSVWCTSVTLALGLAAAEAQETARWDGVPRVVVVGDVHGAYAPLVELLQASGVVDPELRWAAGATHLVSVGDLLDRGADARDVLELVMRLQREAFAAGGRVHIVLGNHELMNLQGDWRYVAHAEYGAFAADEAEVEREAAYAEFVAEHTAPAVAPAGASPPLDTDAAAARELFDRTYPRGYFARRAAFAADGRYGEWLLGLPAVVVVNDVAYVHGGLPPLLVAEGLGINGTLHASLRRYLELREALAAAGVLPRVDARRDIELAHAALPAAAPEIAAQLEELLALDASPVLGLEGPLWSRRSVYCKPLLERPVVDAALERLGAARAVVGHTPTGDRRVRALHDGRLVTLDTGMFVDYFGGRPGALVIEGDALHVQYTRPIERAPIEASGAAVAHGLTEAQLRGALERDPPAAVERGAQDEPWRVTLQHGATALAALFYPQRGGELELAAAALDDLLGTALVPPTVERTIEGERGALQFHFPDAVTEAERLERGLGFGWCPIEPQLGLLYAFDLLTFNRGRTPDNVLYHTDLSDLTVTGHGQAFGPERALPRVDPSRLSVPPELVAPLRALDEAKLRAALGAWLDSRRIRALLARRDRLLGD